ncbi:MAG: fold protein [Mucilaginibacter sp.]|nr:fold protein [Mucilaginibacter sp.]
MELSDINSDLTAYDLAIADHISAMLAYWDTNLVCRFANSAYLDWFGFTKEQMVNKMTLDELLGPLYVLNLPYIKGALAGKPQTFERTIAVPGGGVRYSLANYIPDIAEGVVKGFYVHGADITPLILRRLSVTGNDSGDSPAFNPLAAVEATLRECLLTRFPGISTLSKIHGISESKLKRDFKGYYNDTIFGFYRRLQMELAQHYLKEARYNKKQIAWMFSFANPSNFSACYKKYLKESCSDDTANAG